MAREKTLLPLFNELGIMLAAVKVYIETEFRIRILKAELPNIPAEEFEIDGAAGIADCFEVKEDFVTIKLMRLDGMDRHTAQTKFYAWGLMVDSFHVERFGISAILAGINAYRR